MPTGIMVLMVNGASQGVRDIMSWVEMHGWRLDGKVACQFSLSGMSQLWSGASLPMTPLM